MMSGCRSREKLVLKSYVQKGNLLTIRNTFSKRISTLKTRGYITAGMLTVVLVTLQQKLSMQIMEPNRTLSYWLNLAFQWKEKLWLHAMAETSGVTKLNMPKNTEQLDSLSIPIR